MSSRLAADRQIRAAALRAAPALDVRGPVSRALARTHVEVPPAPLAAVDRKTPEAPGAPGTAASRSRALEVDASPETVRPSLSTRGVRPADRVVKPFREAPWPSRRNQEAEPVAVAGLTRDERRVHHALVDALDGQTQTDYDGRGTMGLSYLERKRLRALDLAFINAKLAEMERPLFTQLPRVRLAFVLVAVVGIVALGAAMFVGEGADGSVLTFVALAALAVSSLVELFGLRATTPERQRIYQALRELALLAHDPAEETTAELHRSDRLIDALADHKPLASASRTRADRLADGEPAPHLVLDDVPTPATGTLTSRPRARS